jgi:SAM-dependent methyltransferase
MFLGPVTTNPLSRMLTTATETTTEPELNIDTNRNFMWETKVARVPTFVQYTYGSSEFGGRWKDVTAVIGKLLSKAQEIVVSNDRLGGDPHPGVVKQVRITYAGVVISRVQEGCLLQLAPIGAPCASFRTYAPILERARGLEIGGPSPHMAGLGVYHAPSHLDNANFSPSTLWSAGKDGDPYLTTLPGQVFVVDAVNLTAKLPLASYDFVFSSHVLEHLVNPLKALHQMAAVTKPFGYALHVLPWKQGTFDHRRPITPFDDLVQHFVEDRSETDGVADHMQEVEAFYDLDRDPGAGTRTQFLQRCAAHTDNRALHVHVFDFALMVQCLDHAGFRVLDTQLVHPYHQVVLAQKMV